MIHSSEIKRVAKLLKISNLRVDRYAVLIPDGLDEAERIEIPDWEKAVEQCLQNINFMISSSSLITRIDVSDSVKPRDSLDDLTESLVNAVKRIIEIHPNKETINQPIKRKW